MKIYTKVGDGGDTFLFGGAKVRKDHPRVRAYGDVDELNAVLGLAAAQAVPSLRPSIVFVQEELFILGADLSAPWRAKTPKPVPRIGSDHIRRLEREIDVCSDRLPPLKNFILPGGSEIGASLHMARAVCRRAERSLTPLLKRDRTLTHAQIYLNRLSDYLFVLARTASRLSRQPEKIWRN